MYALGMPSLLELTNLAANAAACRRLGLTFVELNMNLPWSTPENLPASELQWVARQTGITFTLHLPEELDLGSFHPQLRRASLDRAVQAVQWASDAGIDFVTLHINPGVYFTLPDRKEWLYGIYASQFQPLLQESFEMLFGCARSLGVQVGLENTGHFGEPFMFEALESLAEIPGLWLTWDTGHNAASLSSDQPALDRHNDRIAHIHLHDSDGRLCHLPLFTGCLPVEDVLRFARERDIRVVVEVKTLDALEQSLEALAERGLFILP